MDLSGNQSFPHDVFAPFYSSWMDKAFSVFKPTTFSDVFPIIQYQYRQTPDKFKVISPLHQNDENDKLHFSVELSLPYLSYRFHIYGYYKNVFIIQRVEYTVSFYNQITQPKSLVEYQ